jgi:hypothetical protein
VNKTTPSQASPKRGHSRKGRVSAAVGLSLIAGVSSLVGVTPTRASANGVGRDYASDAFSNPWDYDDPSDIVIGDGPMLNIAGASVAGGNLSFDSTGPGYISPLWGSYPGSIYGRMDGAFRPIDTGVYNRLAFKLTSSATINAGVRWYTCPDGAVQDSCQGGFAFDIKSGTHVYDFALTPSGLDPALDAPWSGGATGLRLAFAGAAHMDLDWMSVYGGKAPSADGPVGPSANVINPDIEGGESLGPKIRQHDWDMDDPSDIKHTYNVQGSIANGSFNGVNAGPAVNDPAVVLNLGCKTFQAADFHRLTVDMTYNGPFNVEDRAGGGMNQRVIWRIAGTPLDPNGNDLQNSDDIVMYPGRRRFTVDLKTANPIDITDPAQAGPRKGWVGEIEKIRFDPNEDRGARSWKLHSVKLAADDMAAPGSPFAIEWSDANYRPGGSANVAISSSPDGSGATTIASNVPVNDGVNKTMWTAEGSGRKWVVLTINRDGYESRSVSTGPVNVSPIPSYQFGINERGSDGVFDVGDRCAGSASAPAAPAPKVLALTQPKAAPKAVAPKAGKVTKAAAAAKPKKAKKIVIATKK